MSTTFRALPRRMALVALTAGSVGACNLVAGLDQFHPATDSAATSTTSSAGGGGAGTESTTASSSASMESVSSTASSSSTGGPGCATHLLLNEVRLHDDFVELYNPTNATIDLSAVTVWALASGGSFSKKWLGASGDDVKPGGYFLIVGTPGNFTGEDDVFSNGISDTQDPTVVIVTGANDVLIDSVCVCSAPGCAQAFMEELCDQRSLPAPAFQSDLGDGVSRQGCKDTDDDAVDFTVACPTPKAQNGSIACP